MVTLKSDIVEVARTQEDLYNFLSDLNNFKTLIPEEMISEWNSTADECSFKVPGIGKIGFKKSGATPPSLIKLQSISNKPFAFSLDINIVKVTDTTSRAQLTVNADVNPFMKMMIEKPLSNFFNKIANRLKNVEV